MWWRSLIVSPVTRPGPRRERFPEILNAHATSLADYGRVGVDNVTALVGVRVVTPAQARRIVRVGEQACMRAKVGTVSGSTLSLLQKKCPTSPNFKRFSQTKKKKRVQNYIPNKQKVPLKSTEI